MRGSERGAFCGRRSTRLEEVLGPKCEVLVGRECSMKEFNGGTQGARE